MLRRPPPRIRPVTGRGVVVGGLVAAALLAGVRYVDAEQASAAGRSGSIVDLMLGHQVHHESPWDFTGPGGPVTCYGDTTGFGTADEQCDTDRSQAGIQLPGPAPLTHLKPGAACPSYVPPWATCDNGKSGP